MKRVWVLALVLVSSSIALAFCGFYVAKVDSKLFNESSEVIIAREGKRTILSMSNDYKGDVSEFALVVPIPYVFTQEQIQVGDATIFDRIGAYSAPRLVEYFDDDPCYRYENEGAVFEMAAPTATVDSAASIRAKSLGVTIEEQFSVGEYDILILGAEESTGLETWLIENGYKLPNGASEALAPYIAMDMKFFVAKVNLEAFADTGFKNLRPILMAFESNDFMLPIQLGMVNAAGPQDLIVYLLSPEGRVEVANYPTVTMPSDVYVPEFVEDEFGDMYRATFDTAYKRENRKSVFLEYAWDMAWCDPCAADPLSGEEMAKAGVFWLDESSDFAAPNVYLTRLHVRYSKDYFPEDLMFRVTGNRDNFQGRYIIQRPYSGTITCQEGQSYIEQVQERQKQEAQALANLTGWSYGSIMEKVSLYNPSVEVPSWWKRVFERFGN
ncbi:MAG: DUF2330 domain-containing protein [Trueperaceae bacterium]|nr:DUF2330 domain-containing protein [Trueperaceae bacterium]